LEIAMPITLPAPALAPVARMLRAMMDADTLPHALLVEGSTEADRREAAAALARAVVCGGSDQQEDEDEAMFGGMSLFGEAQEEPQGAGETILPCNNCQHCHKSKENIHPDLRIVEGGAGARSFHIDAIRALRQDAGVLPNEAACKVYVLHNAQAMTVEAQNALLKLLEEPPDYVCLILTAPTRKKLLPTVISRVFALSLGEAVTEALDAEREEKAQGIAKNLARALVGDRPYARLEATAPLEGDRDLVREVLPATRKHLHAMLVKEPAKAERLLGLIEGVRGLEGALERNANLNLLVTMAAGL
jgi:DNA polymerase III delta prime subunit